MEAHTIYTQDSTDLFRNPAIIIITGYSNSGKSEMCSNLIKKYHHKFNTILYCGVNSRNLQNNPNINEKLHISSEIVSSFDYSYNGNTLFILDDCFLEAIESKFVLTLSRLDDDICCHPFFSSKRLDDDICRHPKIFFKNIFF